MTATTELITRLGAPVEGEPIVLTNRAARVVVSEHERGWSIVGTSTLHPAPFLATVWRCAGSHGDKRAPYDCLGHAENVQRLARKVLATYKGST